MLVYLAESVATWHGHRLVSSVVQEKEANWTLARTQALHSLLRL